MAEHEAVKKAEEPDPNLQSSNGGAGQHPPDRLNGSSIIHVEDEHHRTEDLQSYVCTMIISKKKRKLHRENI